MVAYVDLDERAIDALREFNEEGALSVLQQFKESDLSHVQVRHYSEIPLNKWTGTIYNFFLWRSSIFCLITFTSLKNLVWRGKILVAEFSEAQV